MKVNIKFKNEVIIAKGISQLYLENVDIEFVNDLKDILCIKSTKFVKDVFVPISNVASYTIES
jgi:hypothetical protein